MPDAAIAPPSDEVALHPTMAAAASARLAPVNAAFVFDFMLCSHFLCTRLNDRDRKENYSLPTKD